jgi:hypothetical protein
MNDANGTTHPKARMKSNIILFISGALFFAISLIWGITDNIPSILLLLIGLCFMLYSVLRNFGTKKTLKPGLQLLYWSPRVICIIFSAFAMLFSFDVFEEGKGFWETSIAFLMHNIPVFVMIIILIVTWRWEWIGGIIFCLLGFIYIVMEWGRFPFGTYAIISGPLFLTGILFLLNWKYRKILKEDSQYP